MYGRFWRRSCYTHHFQSDLVMITKWLAHKKVPLLLPILHPVVVVCFYHWSQWWVPSVSECHQLQRSEEMFFHVTKSLGSFYDSIIKNSSSFPPSCSAVLKCRLGLQRTAPHGHKMTVAVPGIISRQDNILGKEGLLVSSLSLIKSEQVSPTLQQIVPHHTLTGTSPTAFSLGRGRVGWPRLARTEQNLPPESWVRGGNPNKSQLCPQEIRGEMAAVEATNGQWNNPWFVV